MKLVLWIFFAVTSAYVISGCGSQASTDAKLHSEAQAIRQYNEEAMKKMDLPPGDGPSQM